MLLHELHQEALRRDPRRNALIVGDRRLAFAEMEETASLYARALAVSGVGRGDRVSLFMGNCPELACLFQACFRLGAVAVPHSCFNTKSEIAYEIDHCQAKVLLVGSELHPRVEGIRQEAPSLKEMFVPDAPAGESALRSLGENAGAAARKAAESGPAHAKDPAVVLYTSGSTGKPKGVVHSHHSLFHNTANRCRTLRHRPGDAYLSSSFLCHGAALSNLFLPMLHCGGTTVLMDHFSPEGFLECLRSHRPAIATSSPFQLRAVLDHPRCRREDFASVKWFYSGGDQAPLSLLEAFREKTGLELREGLGMTECGGYLIGPPFEEARRGTVGKPIHGTEIKLTDHEGRSVEEGEVGEIRVRTEALMTGYWNDPENTAAALVDGWLRTGDLGRRDEEGYYCFVGRSKHIILRDTGNVAPGEVEEVLDAHPKIGMSAVTGIPDEGHGQAVLAFVVPEDRRDMPSVGEMRSFAAQRISERKVPLRWEFTDEIPLTDMGKIDRAALAEMARKLTAVED